MRTTRFIWKVALTLVAVLSVASCDFPLDLDLDLGNFEIIPSGNPTWPDDTNLWPYYAKYNLQAAATDGRTVVAVGDKIAYLDSNATWSFAPPYGFRDVIWVDTMFIAASFGGNVGFSPDGRSWSVCSLPHDTDCIYSLVSIAYSGKEVVIAGKAQSSLIQRAAMYVMNESGSWDMIGPFDSVTGLSKLVWADSQFVASGWYYSSPTWTSVVLTSSDGRDWTRHDTTSALAQFDDIIWCDDHFLAASGKWILSSVDCIEWTKIAELSGEIRGLHRHESTYLAVGSSGHVSISHDGTTWEKVPFPVQRLLNAAIYADGKYYVFGIETIYSSEDGTEWIECKVNL